MAGYADVASLLRECRDPATGWVLPSPRASLASVPGVLLAELASAARGVIVLGVDGLAHHAATRCWPAASITFLTGVVPTTSATAWLTALTGAGPRAHGVPGMVYRVGDDLVHAVTGASLTHEGRAPRDAVLPVPTVFERAGVTCLAVGRELDRLPGPWARALLRGAERVAAPPTSAALAADAADPPRLADAVIADVDAATASGAALVWVYVNLDDHVHTHGYDDRACDALRRLDRAAARWAAAGWTVVAHADHGQVPVRPDPALAAAWAAVDAECALPSGGAGRLRWLHPRPGRQDAVRARLADALGDAAVVLPAGDLRVAPEFALPADRVGAVLAVAADERFPLPDLSLRHEHGAFDADEMIIPLAVWRPRAS